MKKILKILLCLLLIFTFIPIHDTVNAITPEVYYTDVYATGTTSSSQEYSPPDYSYMSRLSGTGTYSGYDQGESFTMRYTDSVGITGKSFISQGKTYYFYQIGTSSRDSNSSSVATQYEWVITNQAYKVTNTDYYINVRHPVNNRGTVSIFMTGKQYVFGGVEKYWGGVNTQSGGSIKILSDVLLTSSHSPMVTEGFRYVQTKPYKTNSANYYYYDKYKAINNFSNNMISGGGGYKSFFSGRYDGILS